MIRVRVRMMRVRVRVMRVRVRMIRVRVRLIRVRMIRVRVRMIRVRMIRVRVRLMRVRVIREKVKVKPGSHLFCLRCVATRSPCRHMLQRKNKKKILFLHCIALQHVSKSFNMHFWLQCHPSKKDVNQA